VSKKHKLSRKEIFLTVVALAIVGLILIGPFDSKEMDNLKNVPPSFSISTSKYLGSLDANECLPFGVSYTQEETDAYTDPDFLPEDRNTLREGLSLYHASQDYTMDEIIDLIAPNVSNRVFIVYYSNGGDSNDEGFHIYPSLPEGTQIEDSSTTIYDVENADSVTIPANTGFGVYSCLEVGLWKVKSENTEVASMLDLSTAGDGWILMPASEESSLTTNLETVKDSIESVWAQNGDGYNFVEENRFTDIDQIELEDNQYMLWVNIDSNLVPAEEIETENETETEVVCSEPSMTYEECGSGACNYPQGCVQVDESQCYTCEVVDESAVYDPTGTDYQINYEVEQQTSSCTSQGACEADSTCTGPCSEYPDNSTCYTCPHESSAATYDPGNNGIF
jgi:hypothetical protein